MSERVTVTFSMIPTKDIVACKVYIHGAGEDGGFLSPPKNGFLSGPKDHSFAEAYLRFLRDESFDPAQRCKYARGSYCHFFGFEDSKQVEVWLLAQGATKLRTDM